MTRSRTLANHPDLWLREDVAQALDAYESVHGVLPLSSAGRWDWEQQELIDRWDKGGVSNRPPYLYPPYRPASGSPHVRDGGVAIDTPEFRRFREHSEEFGFVWFGEDDPVHFDFIGWNGVVVSAPEEEDNTMILYFIMDNADGNGVPGWVLHNTAENTFSRTLKASDDRGQEIADGWARTFGNARRVTRQDVKNAVALINDTREAAGLPVRHPFEP